MTLDSMGNEMYPVASGVRFTEYETVDTGTIQQIDEDQVNTPTYDGAYGVRPM